MTALRSPRKQKLRHVEGGVSVYRFATIIPHNFRDTAGNPKCDEVKFFVNRDYSQLPPALSSHYLADPFFRPGNNPDILFAHFSLLAIRSSLVSS